MLCALHGSTPPLPSLYSSLFVPPIRVLSPASSPTPSLSFLRSVFLFTPDHTATPGSSVASRSPIGGSDLLSAHNELRWDDDVVFKNQPAVKPRLLSTPSLTPSGMTSTENSCRDT